MHKAVFLDRDGVISELVYHEEQGIIDSPFTPAQVKLFPWAGEAIRKLAEGGYRTFITSNQPGMAKGQYTRKTFESIREKLRDDLVGQGSCVDGEYYCFHHPDAVIADLKKQCQCRKPQPGLLLQAAREHGIDLNNSWMVGDNLTDVQAGKNAGCKTVLLGTMKCQLCRLMDEQDARPDIIATNLSDAASAILKSEV